MTFIRPILPLPLPLLLLLWLVSNGELIGGDKNNEGPLSRASRIIEPSSVKDAARLEPQKAFAPVSHQQSLQKLQMDESLQENDYDDTEDDTQDDVKDRKRNDRTALLRGPKIWDHWGKWSQCSVTCGVGKITRWRHCVSGGCASGEKEAQIKTCTLPAC